MILRSVYTHIVFYSSFQGRPGRLAPPAAPPFWRQKYIAICNVLCYIEIGQVSAFSVSRCRYLPLEFCREEGVRCEKKKNYTWCAAGRYSAAGCRHDFYVGIWCLGLLQHFYILFFAGDPVPEQLAVAYSYHSLTSRVSGAAPTLEAVTRHAATCLKDFKNGQNAVLTGGAK